MTKIASFTAEQNAEQEARSGKVMPYTPTPWKMGKLIRGSWDQWDITAEIAGMHVAIAATPGGNGNDSSNATRIVACVNACEGISNEHLPEVMISCRAAWSAWDANRAERDALKARERELVEALRIGLARCTMQEHADADALDNTSANARWIRQARAVLAKVKPE